MPLIKSKSKKAFEENVKTEMEANPGKKNRAQNLAIAYSVKRKAAGKKKMAEGGEAKAAAFKEYTEHSDKDYASQEAGDKVGKGLSSIRGRHDTLEDARAAHGNAHPEAKKHYADALTHYKNAEKAYSKYKKMAQGGSTDADSDTVVIPDKGYGKIIRTGMAKGGSVDEGPSEKENQMGVNKIVPNYDRAHSEVKHGQSEARYGNKKAKHEGTLAELRSMPKPKIQGFYDGGEVDVNDQEEIRKNRGDKPAHNDNWTDRSTVAQAQKPSITRLSQPKMVGSDAFSVRSREEADKDLMRMDSMPPESPKAQPPGMYDEEEADKSGPSVPALKMKRMAEGGHVEMEIGSGPEEDAVEHPAGLEEDNDSMSPARDEYMAGHFAEGGSVEDMSEEEEEHHMSIAAAIMAKRSRMAKAGSDSGSPDEEHAERSMFAEGGEVDLSQNADEEPNHEDQYSFNALKKENYSESDGLKQLSSPKDSNEHGHDLPDEDSHDMVSKIRSQMRVKRQFR